MPLPTRVVLAARSSSLPPMHLASDEAGPFPWQRLPPETQRAILRLILLPPSSPTLIISDPAHRTHMQTTALPMLLALGSWDAYLAAARILYEAVEVRISAAEATTFLAAPRTLRLRGLVTSIRVLLDMPGDLELFERSLGGWGNVPTALRSMRVRGLLDACHFVVGLPEGGGLGGRERGAGCGMPMARLQLALAHGGKGGILPGRVVVAPAFLVTRSFQCGFLLLLEQGGFERASLTVQHPCPKSRQGSRDVVMDALELRNMWLGATLLENLSDTEAKQLARDEWIDPFAVPGQVDDEDGNEALRVLQYIAGDDRQEPSGPWADEDSDDEMLDGYDMVIPDSDDDMFRVDNISTPETPSRLPQLNRVGFTASGDDLLPTLDSSPMRYDPSSSGASDSEDEDVVLDIEALMHAGPAADDEDGASDSAESTMTDVFSPCPISDAVLESAPAEPLPPQEPPMPQAPPSTTDATTTPSNDHLQGDVDVGVLRCICSTPPASDHSSDTGSDGSQTTITQEDYDRATQQGTSATNSYSPSSDDQHIPATPTAQVPPHLSPPRPNTSDAVIPAADTTPSPSSSSLDSEASPSSTEKDKENKDPREITTREANMSGSSIEQGGTTAGASAMPCDQPISRLPSPIRRLIEKVFTGNVSESCTGRGANTAPAPAVAPNQSTSHSFTLARLRSNTTTQGTQTCPATPVLAKSVLAINPTIHSVVSPLQTANTTTATSAASSTAGQKRKAPLEGQEEEEQPPKLSKRARRRANKRARQQKKAAARALVSLTGTTATTV